MILSPMAIQHILTFIRSEESIAPMYTKTLHDLTIAIINKSFEFQNYWLKIIRIRYNCTQFCPIPLG